ncbi:MAG: type II toxin-antitoxin system VapC family toxin [Terracidiphilus sp.]
MLRIYLDACALNRLTDPPSQPRISLEAAAVEQILLLVRSGKMRWVASSILGAELARSPNRLRRSAAFALLELASEMKFLSATVAAGGKQLEVAGLKEFDALHLAVAEECGCDVLLTTDDRFRKWAYRNPNTSSVRIENPLDYLKEVLPWPPSRK